MKRSLSLPDPLTTDEQARLLKQPNRRYPTGERNRLMLALMLDTGLRLAEAINLRWDRVDLQIGRIMVKNGKGGKDAALWTHEANIEALRSWRVRQSSVLAERGRIEGSPWVFSTLDGGPLGPRYVERMVARYAAKAGIEKRVHPHLLRHSFATDMLRKTGNLEIVRKACRHESVATTQIYTHLVDEDLEGAMKGLREGAMKGQ